MAYTAQQTVDVLARASDVLRELARLDMAAAVEHGDVTSETVAQIARVCDLADGLADQVTHIEAYVGITATPIPM